MEESVTMKETAAWGMPRETSSAPWSEEDFEQLFRQHYARIAGVLRKMTGDSGQAEELADELFWKLYRQPPPERDRLGGWLYRGAVRAGIDALRARRRRQQHEEAAAPPEVSGSSDGPEAQLLRGERIQRVRTVLAGLKPAQAQLLLLRSCGLSYRELADLMGVQTGSIGTLLNRAEAAFERAWRAYESKGGRV